MKTTVKPGKTSTMPKKSTSKQGSDKNVSSPKKPGNDPDQTPNREVEKTPVAQPDKKTSRK